MPCYRCGARQTDPVKGPSPWKRGVKDDRQVLICPDCQRVHDWRSDLDRCARCGSTALVRALGETRCRDCGWSHAASADTPGPVTGQPAPGLSEDVEAALARLLGRRPSRP